MNKYIFLSLFVLLSGTLTAQKIDFEKIKNEAGKILDNSSLGKGLSQEEVVKGLKEALSIGSNNAGSLASKLDGYYKNPLLFIPFPPEAQKVATKLRELGFGKKVDQFIMTLNRSAEEAAKQSAPIFVTAVKNLTITDGMNILKGSNDAATQYLKRNTNSQLTTQFKPVITAALQKTSATKYWTDLTTLYNKIPGVTKVNTDLGAYTTERAINGLFVLVAQEELKIRKDPAARITDILKKVFGSV